MITTNPNAPGPIKITVELGCSAQCGMHQPPPAGTLKTPTRYRKPQRDLCPRLLTNHQPPTCEPFARDRDENDPRGSGPSRPTYPGPGDVPFPQDPPPPRGWQHVGPTQILR